MVLGAKPRLWTHKVSTALPIELSFYPVLTELFSGLLKSFHPASRELHVLLPAATPELHRLSLRVRP